MQIRLNIVLLLYCPNIIKSKKIFYLQNVFTNFRFWMAFLDWIFQKDNSNYPSDLVPHVSLFNKICLRARTDDGDNITLVVLRRSWKMIHHFFASISVINDLESALPSSPESRKKKIGIFPTKFAVTQKSQRQLCKSSD